MTVAPPNIKNIYVNVEKNINIDKVYTIIKNLVNLLIMKI